MLPLGLLVVCLTALVMVVAGPAFAASDASSNDQDFWPWVEAEYPVQDDGGPSAATPAKPGAASASVDVVFDDDPAYGASSSSKALVIADLTGPAAAEGGAGIAADPAANAWSLAEVEYSIMSRRQQGRSGRVHRVPASFCLSC